MRCIVPSCDYDSARTSKSHNITFHLLPSEESRRVAWLKALGNIDWEGTVKTVGVCSSHFSPEDMYEFRGRRRLKPDAVPVLKQDSSRTFDCSLKQCNVKVTRLQPNKCVMLAVDHFTKLRDAKTCRICLATECKLYSTSLNKDLDTAYETLTGLKIENEKHLPPYLCTECAQRLLNSQDIRTRSLQAHMILLDIDKNHDFITLETIKSIDRNQVKSNLVVSHNQPNYYDLEIEYTEQEDIHVDPQSDNDYLKEIKIEKDNMFEVTVNNEEININVLRFSEHEETVGNEAKTEMNKDSNWDGDGDQDTKNKATNGTDISMDDPISDNNLLQERLRKIKRRRVGVKKITELKKESVKSITKRGRKRKTSVDQTVEAANDTGVKDKRTKTDGGGRGVGKRKKKGKVAGRKKAKEHFEETSNGNSNLEEENLDELQQFLEKQRALTYRREQRPVSLDLSLFTVTNLSMEQQMQEVQRRREQPAYHSAPYKCTVCYRSFKKKYDYDSHIVKHDEVSGAYLCVICQIRTLTPIRLRKHITAAHTREYSCKLCPFVSRHLGVARQHQNFHAGKIHKCPHCDKIFNKHTTYQNHVRNKHVSHIVCALCGYTFANERGLNLHIKIKHKNIEGLAMDGPYCDSCDVQFVSELAYKRHLLLSSKHCTDDDPNRISNNPNDVCPDPRRLKPYTNPYVERRRKAKGETTDTPPSGPVVCEQCGEEQETRAEYSRHFRREHPGKNRTQFPPNKTMYMCELCGHVYHCHLVLMKHMWQRHGVGDWRPPPPAPPRSPPPKHECPVCGKTFTIKYNFKKHVFGHTGQRPFKCDKCPKNFKSRSQRRTHESHVHLKKPWPKQKRRKASAASKIPVSIDKTQVKKDTNEMDDLGTSVSCKEEQGVEIIDETSTVEALESSIYSDEERSVADETSAYGASVTSEEKQRGSEIDDVDPLESSGVSISSDDEYGVENSHKTRAYEVLETSDYSDEESSARQIDESNMFELGETSDYSNDGEMESEFDKKDVMEVWQALEGSDEDTGF